MAAKKHSFFYILSGITVVILIVISLLIDNSLRSRNPRHETQLLSPTQSTAATPTFEPMDNGFTPADAYAAISSERMYSTLTDLTAIQAHSGWRGSATAGEREALDYMQSRMNELSFLAGLEMTLERETFNVFMATEDYDSSVFFSTESDTVEVPADATRGHRDDPSSAARMDSDGQINGLASSPVTVEGPVELIPDADALLTLSGRNMRGSILLVDFSVVDTMNPQGISNAEKILALDPSAVVLVTHYSNAQGESHGTYAGDGGGVFQRLVNAKAVPLLFIEMENLTSLSVSNWDEMSKLVSARVTWDTDVSNPAVSGNLIAHIPGRNPSKPVLISAHIDSPNSPGAMDDGSGSAILLEIATVLDELRIQPETDLYLAWFGSEELGLYGSTYFTTTHSDLLNHLQANIQIDCLARPLDDMPAKVTFMFSHINSENLVSDPLAQYLLNQANDLQVNVDLTYWPFASDNGSLSAFDIPNLDIIYQSQEMENANGGIWVTGHFHDPYDTVELAHQVEDAFVDMARIAFTGAFVPARRDDFVTHTADKKAVFLANHTEAPHMTPTGLPEFSLALIRAGYQVSVVPYGQPVTAENLAGADLVVVLPAYDYPSEGTQTASVYDTSWSDAEAELLNSYVTGGGKLLVINSANRLKFYNRLTERNEDWSDLNTLVSQWGVSFTGLGSDKDVLNTEDHGLMEDISALRITSRNAVFFSMEQGEVLAGVKSKAYLAHLQEGKGQVIILGDLSVLGEGEQGLLNPLLVRNLANWK